MSNEQDPIAAAAANLQADAAPSSTEPSLLDRANETIHDLEAKIEHLIHPEAASEPQSAAGEPAGAAEASQPSDSSPPAAEPAQTNSAPASLVGEQGNVQAAEPATSADAPAPATATAPAEASGVSAAPSAPTDGSGGEPPNAAPTAGDTAATPAGGDAPNAVSAAVSLSESDASSFAPSASPVAGIVGLSASAGERARAAIKAIKDHLHLKGFEQSSVLEIHVALAEIENAVKDL